MKYGEIGYCSKDSHKEHIWVLCKTEERASRNHQIDSRGCPIYVKVYKKVKQGKYYPEYLNQTVYAKKIHVVIICEQYKISNSTTWVSDNKKKVFLGKGRQNDASHTTDE